MTFYSTTNYIIKIFGVLFCKNPKNLKEKNLIILIYIKTYLHT